MTAKSDVIAPIKPFVISREFDAPRALVWKAWTEPEHLAQWWGPKGAVVVDSKLDFRPGGMFHYRMRFGEHDMWGRQCYREIAEPEKIVFINSFSDEFGGMTHHPMNPDWPGELLTTVTFTEAGGKTTVTVEWIPINATKTEIETFDAGRASMKQGWSGTFDQLAEYLAKR